MNFLGRVVSNHTAFIRIRTIQFNAPTQLLILPVEIEVTTGRYGVNWRAVNKILRYLISMVEKRCHMPSQIRFTNYIYATWMINYHHEVVLSRTNENGISRTILELEPFFWIMANCPFCTEFAWLLIKRVSGPTSHTCLTIKYTCICNQ